MCVCVYIGDVINGIAHDRPSTFSLLNSVNTINVKIITVPQLFNTYCGTEKYGRVTIIRAMFFFFFLNLCYCNVYVQCGIVGSSLCCTICISVD